MTTYKRLGDYIREAIMTRTGQSPLCYDFWSDFDNLQKAKIIR